jgi:hypothetical protein
MPEELPASFADPFGSSLHAARQSKMQKLVVAGDRIMGAMYRHGLPLVSPFDSPPMTTRRCYGVFSRSQSAAMAKSSSRAGIPM